MERTVTITMEEYTALLEAKTKLDVIRRTHRAKSWDKDTLSAVVCAMFPEVDEDA